MMHEYIQEGDSKFKNVSGWKEERNRILQEIGGRLKVGLTLIQTLLGNHVSFHDRPMIFGKDRWEKGETHYSFDIKKRKDEVNLFVRLVMGQSGNEAMAQKYKKILDYKGYNHGSSGKQLKELITKDSTGEYAKMANLSKELLTKEDINVNLFGDVEKIERALNQYVATMD